MRASRCFLRKNAVARCPRPTPKAQSEDSPRSNIGQLSQIFERLVDAPPELRDGLLEELCLAPDLRRQVQTMLAADSEADPLLDHSLVPQPVTVDLGESIDGYKLLRELGDGGMGLVYEAEQLEPVRRNVALKIMKPGLDTRDVIERFNAERQALSMMSHPNIAKVFDAGATETGRPYFVMELVRGRPITPYCEEKSLDLTARLQLFLTVCHAIQHAHQKGVIHRDIKPSNVLVGDVDGRSVAKVIDFGVAKAIHGRRSDATEFTRAGQIVGTLDYMSPEQSRPHSTDVDTRSDIYSLASCSTNYWQTDHRLIERDCGRRDGKRC